MNGVLRLDANEGPPPPAGLLAALARSGAAVLSHYPDDATVAAAIAARFGVAADQVLLTTGADDAIDRCCRRWLAPGKRLLVSEPTFEMIERFGELAGATIDRVRWTGGPFPVAETLARLRPTTGLIALVSPANPTGSIITRDEFTLLADGAGDTPLLLDHAYVEFADDDLTSLALRYPGVVVVRTLSKAWGLAGCRIGFALGEPARITALRSAGGPYPVSGLALAVAAERLRQDDVRDVVTRVRHERFRLEQTLAGLGVPAVPSQANFVLANFGERAAFVRAALRATGILVRDCSRRPGVEGSLRISLPGNEDAFSRLTAALRTICRPSAILFDLDGVLADVSGSYRQCIIDAAASYGVEVTAAQVVEQTMRGEANDDWQLTARLLAQRGVTAPLEQVTTRFQRRYAELRERERWLARPEWLRRLAERLPLAIVTGRPRDEAEWLLSRSGVRDCFAALVAREDAPLKPDPAPLRLALHRLGADSAWMIGDTPDDVRAALAAGVLPLAIPAPGDDRAQAQRAFAAAGAAWTLDTLEALESLWT